MLDASALPSLFIGTDLRIPRLLTPSGRRALTALEAARPFGLVRVPGGWRSLAGFASLQTGTLLCAEALARIDYKGRNPRLKITVKGRAALFARRIEAPHALSDQLTVVAERKEAGK